MGENRNVLFKETERNITLKN
jgi:hypothetical protein